MVVFVLIYWLVALIVVGTLVGALVGIRRDVGRIADILERAHERDRMS
ncbi:MAG TPA: hypothetical protein VM287_01865 [Egibacteraceae bacterium]|nr:hypothetical protein [Egibacteraceae bacterium]